MLNQLLYILVLLLFYELLHIVPVSLQLLLLRLLLMYTIVYFIMVTLIGYITLTDTSNITINY
jgi:hypothetical protein